jgi:hypothetical protein
MKVLRKSAKILTAVGILFLASCGDKPTEELSNKIKRWNPQRKQH